MSETATTPAGPVSPAAEIGLPRAVAAELVRARHSAAARFAAAGLAVSVLQGLGWWLVSTSPMRDWFGLFGWQSIYATALLAPLVALLAAAAVARESAAREGGTWARPLSPRTALLARTLVLAWQNLLFQAALTLPVLAFGLAGGLTDPPVGRLLTLWIVQWATSLLPLVLGFVLARRIGMIAATVLAFVWQIAGAILAERPLWWAQPWTWNVRAIIPVLGIHQNAVRLEPGAPQWGWSPWWPTLACALLAAVVVALAAARARITTSPRRTGLARLRRLLRTAPAVDAPEESPRPARRGLSAAGSVVRGPARLFGAQWRLLRATAIPTLVVVSLVTLALVGAVWDDAYVTGFATWLLVPLGSAVLGALAWNANADGWRVAALRTTVPRFASSVLGVGAVILAVVVAAATLVAHLSRGTGVGPAFPALLFLVGGVVFTLSLWLSTRFGVGATLGVVLVLLVGSVVIGGSWFADTGLWVIGILGWPLTAGTPTRLLVALPACLALSAAATWGWLSALWRAAR